MEWKTIIKDLEMMGINQHEIQRCTGIRQPSLSRILAGRQKDLMYRNGVKLLQLHRFITGKRKKFSPAPNR